MGTQKGKPTLGQLDKFWTTLGWRKEERQYVGIISYDKPQLVAISPAGHVQWNWPDIKPEPVLFWSVETLWRKDIGLSLVADETTRKYNAYTWFNGKVYSEEPEHSEEGYDNPGLAIFWVVYDTLVGDK